MRLAGTDDVDTRWLAAGAELGESQCLLRRYRPGQPPRRAVLLVHGASANSRTFLVPRGGLIRHLLARDIEVWTLDWRASSLLSRRIRKASAKANLRDAFNLEFAVKHELHAALVEMRASQLPISLLGHCVGGALVAHALSNPSFDVAGVDSVVLTALGAFYRVGLENWLKGNERVLEALANRPGARPSAISPWAASGLDAHRWPDELEELYDIWKTTPARHDCENRFCHGVSFMFGMPYNPNLVEAMHSIEPRDAPASLESALPQHGFWGQFGEMPLGLYIEVAQSLRQGWLANVAPVGLAELRQKLSSVQLTLITGNENQLWHRESVDIMFDWLQRSPRPRRRVVKHVVNGFGHQDLFWCEDSARRRRMYDLLGDALDPRSTAAAAGRPAPEKAHA